MLVSTIAPICAPADCFRTFPWCVCSLNYLLHLSIKKEKGGQLCFVSTAEQIIPLQLITAGGAASGYRERQARQQSYVSTVKRTILNMPFSVETAASN